ncbi:MAG: malto-oligosyltrehalose trehalohydrolase, partial [Magnetococcales bacterium]|nr:malto-oligosyltrehalose trehalohydrolase [Magnetococcales bacterium]
MTRRRHRLPFGAELLETGEVDFRLWAPSLRTVELVLGEGERRLPMTDLGGGWFACVTSLAGAGTLYRFLLPEGLGVPDPASRFQPQGVHGPSEVIDPAAYLWGDGDWRGRPWEESVIQEIHVGSFSPEGSFAGVEARLDHFLALGVTALEIMPVADFPGGRNWGYDGALWYAPDSTYGRPEDFKRLVDAAHRRGIQVFLDVVYNHFGPEGNYLGLYAGPFFDPRRHTPWGAAIRYDGPDSAPVRDFVLHNALYWLEEYHLDGLRLDAVDTIVDRSEEPLLAALARVVGSGPGGEREIHLILENDHNSAHYLARDGTGRAVRFRGQWNDDPHHALHVILTGEEGGYYQDYRERPLEHLG